MQNATQNSFKEKALERIESIPGNVILRSDLQDLGSYRQQNRILRKLVEEQKLARIALGVYAKTIVSPYTDRVILKVGFSESVAEALERLCVKWEPCQVMKDYNEGRTTQIPVRPCIKLNDRFSRKFFYQGNTMQYE